MYICFFIFIILIIFINGYYFLNPYMKEINIKYCNSKDRYNFKRDIGKYIMFNIFSLFYILLVLTFSLI